MLGHVLEHLGGGDYRLAGRVALGDDLFLDDGDFVDRDGDTHVTAGDHDPVGGLHDRIDVSYRFPAFDLGDDPARGPGRLDQIGRFVYVLVVAHER